MDQKKLWDELKRNELRRLYLLYGEEKFLVRFYAKSIEEAARRTQETPLSKDVYEGNHPVSELVLAAITFPFLPGRRFLLVKDSKLFATGRKADAEAMAEFLPQVPDGTIIVFTESDVDRRSKLFKIISEIGFAVQSEKQTPDAISKWLVRQAKSSGVSLSASVASHIMATCGYDMMNLHYEMEKLTSYALTTKAIAREDVDQVSIPTLEARIFSLTKAMGQGDAGAALSHYSSLIALRESPIMILSMMIRQMRLILMVKLGQEKKIPRQKLAQDLRIRDFVINEAMGHGRRFSKAKLLALLHDCLDTDVKIKTGRVGDSIGVETLLIRLSGKG